MNNRHYEDVVISVKINGQVLFPALNQNGEEILVSSVARTKCRCGSIGLRSNLSKHLKTQKHLLRLEQLLETTGKSYSKKELNLPIVE